MCRVFLPALACGVAAFALDPERNATLAARLGAAPAPTCCAGSAGLVFLGIGMPR